MKKMGSILLGFMFMFMFVICTQAGATTYYFSQSGFTDGESVSGWFEATDSDGDGIISSGSGEITSAYFSVSGGSVGSFSKYFSYSEIYDGDSSTSEAFQLVYVLGVGTIGDEDYFWTDGIMVYGSGFVYAAGTPAAFTADDSDVKGTFSTYEYGTPFSSSENLVLVTADSTAVPEPATMLLLGLGMLGLAGARKKIKK